MPTPWIRRGGLAVLALTLALAPAGAAGAASLDQQHVTLQFEGTMTTRWVYEPEANNADPCFDATTHGSGHEQVHFKTHGHVNMTIVDAGGSIAFQLEGAERARPGHFALGFRTADVGRVGLVETDFELAPNHPFDCGPVPPPHKVGELQAPDPHVVDSTGCGGAKFPWDMSPIVVGNKFEPQVAAFLPDDLRVKCPIYPPLNTSDQGSLPTSASAHVSVSAVRRALTPRHGKLIIHGSHHWHYSGSALGPEDINTSMDATWKVTLIRAHPTP